MVRRADSSSASVSPTTRMIRRRPWRMIRPGRLIREKRSAFMRRAPHAGPSTSRFITAFRLWGRIMSPAALAPNSPLGIRPVHDRMDLLALAAAFAQPPDHLIAWQRAVGDDTEQLEAPLGGKLRGGKRQLRGVAQVQLPQGFADRQEAVVGTPPAMPGRHEADLGELLVGPVALTLDG